MAGKQLLVIILNYGEVCGTTFEINIALNEIPKKYFSKRIINNT